MYVMHLRISSKLAYVCKKPFPERVYGKCLIYIAMESINIHPKGVTKLYLSKNNALLTKISTVENRHNIARFGDFELGFILAKFGIF